MKKEEIAKYIDHTILKASATEADIDILCQEAIKYGFASVCVNPTHVKLVSKLLQGTNVKTCTVIGFPLGSNTTETKVFETTNAVDNGAQEIDMVINVGKLIDGDCDYIEQEIASVVGAAKGNCVKVIIETCYLTTEQKEAASYAVGNARACYVKTSTGFGTGGAIVDDVKLMDKFSGDNVMVKASGAVRDYDTAIKMIEAGASRIGTSSGIAIYESAE